jgi:hypothetical protein
MQLPTVTNSTHKLSSRAVAIVAEMEPVQTRLTALLGPAEEFAIFEERLRFTPPSDSGNLNFAINTVEFLLTVDSARTGLLAVTYIGAASGAKDSGVMSGIDTETSPEFREFLTYSGFVVVADLYKKGLRFCLGRLGFDVLLYVPTNVVREDGQLLESVPVQPNIHVLEIQVTGEGEKFEERKKRAETWFVENLKDLCCSHLTVVKF